MPLTEAEICPSGMSHSLLQIQIHSRDNLSEHSLLPAPRVESMTSSSLQEPRETGTSYRVPFANKLRDKRALMRLIKITRLVLLSLQMQEAVGSCPLFILCLQAKQRSRAVPRAPSASGFSPEGSAAQARGRGGQLSPLSGREPRQRPGAWDSQERARAEPRDRHR